VLLADDSLTQQKLTSKLLTRQGHAVTIASNGEEAVQALEADDFDLVLMDVEMPVMDGLQAIGLIRAREGHSGTHIPVFAVTSTGDRDRCLAAGMDAYLSKPLRLDEFNTLLDKLQLWAA
jgi:CheY-like chemotaxis protein